jgi:hypothetical protein
MIKCECWNVNANMNEKRAGVDVAVVVVGVTSWYVETFSF